MPITREQLQNLPLDQLQKLLQQVGEEQTTPTTTPMTTQMTTQPRNPIMRGLQTGLRAFPYLAKTGKIPSETIESDWLTKELAKIQLEQLQPKTASEQLAEIKLNAIQKQREGIQNQQGEIFPVSPKVPISPSISQVSPEITSQTPLSETLPSMFIEKPKGKNEYGIMEYETIKNPEYERWTR